MPILTFTRTLRLDEAESLVGLVKGASYISHHNWERNILSNFQSSNPSNEISEVAYILSEYKIRKPSYCFVVTAGISLKTSLLQIKEGEHFVGVVGKRLELEQAYRADILNKIDDLANSCYYDNLVSDPKLKGIAEKNFLLKIKDQNLRSNLSVADKGGRQKLIAEIIYNLEEFEYFENEISEDG